MENLPNIPRLYTAIAEWLTCLLFILPASKRKNWIPLLGLALVGQILLQSFAGTWPLFFWIPGMILNVVWMYITIIITTNINPRNAIYICSKAFIFAEFIASLAWQLFCHMLWTPQRTISAISFAFMSLVYLLLILCSSVLEKRSGNISAQTEMSTKDIFIAVFTVIIIFSMSNVGFVLSISTNHFSSPTTIFVTRTLVNLCGICILYLQDKQKHELRLLTEINAINNMFQTQYEQYIAYRESSEQINQKFHDLKYQIDIIRAEKELPKKEAYLSEMSQVLNAYSVSINTGNGIIDTILTRKNAYCVDHEITFTCIVDGKLLDHLDIMDTVALFGNALDNAIEAVEKNKKKEERLINLRVFRKEQFIMFLIENYCNEVIDLSTGLPETTKSNKDNHGFGIKSIQFITDKYNGNMNLTYKDKWFSLKILFPFNAINTNKNEPLH